MGAEIWAAILSVILFLYLLKEWLMIKLNKKKKLPPGPKAIPILGHFHLLGNNPHKDMYHLARKHGPIMYMKFGFVPTIVISSPAAAELVLKTHDLIFASRPYSQVSEYISYGQRNIIFGRYSPYWRNMRKLITLELLSQLKINQFHSMRRAEIRNFVGQLKQAAETRETVDLSERISGLGANMICLMVIGKKYDDRDMDDDKGFKALIMETMEVAARFNLADYFPYVEALDLQGLTRRIKDLSTIFDAFLEKIIDDHVQNKSSQKTEAAKNFVETMMAIMDSGEAGFDFDRRHIKAVLLDMLVAGMDTSSTTVEWTMSELLRHPTVMKKLQQELEGVVGMDNMVEESHLESLEYLNFAVKESLRLHPVGPLLIPHESMEDCSLEGFHVPKKSRVIVNAWVIGRDPNVWADPEMFLPERFIGIDIDVIGRDFQLIPFGSGRRGCPGLQLGLLVVRLVVAILVHCFDWELPNGMLPEDLDMSEHFGLVTARAKHLTAIPTHRLCKKLGTGSSPTNPPTSSPTLSKFKTCGIMCGCDLLARGVGG